MRVGLLQLLTTILSMPIAVAQLKTPCKRNDDCKSSLCEDGFCISPFESGCLSRQNRTRFTDRVCNSNDKHLGSRSCRDPDMEYVEIRVAPGNWESALVVGWIYQILLSEIFGIPTTIEHGDGSKKNTLSSFYDKFNRFDLPNQVYSAEALVTAAKLKNGDCRLTSEPCAHILPEVWDGTTAPLINGQINAIENGEPPILREEANGAVGSIGYYIPRFVAQEDPSLALYYGLQSNKLKLADAFLTPINWSQYCDINPIVNCNDGDNIARRKPSNEVEEKSYFVEGLYTGHFRKAAQNDCDITDNCTGHVVSPSCAWDTYGESQFYWNNISLSSTGSELPNGGYEHAHMKEIWLAANATRSNVIMWWWEPDIFMERFVGTDAAFQRVSLEPATIECLQYRRDKIDKCSSDLADRLGATSSGSCDQTVFPLLQFFSSGLRDPGVSELDPLRSPVYEYMRQLDLPSYALLDVFKYWAENVRHDTFDPPREAVCQWIHDKVDDLSSYTPKGYPRVIEEVDYNDASLAGIIIGSIALLLSLTTAFLIYKWRNKEFVKMGRIYVISWVIMGHAIVAVAAIFGAAKPSIVTCSMTKWCTHLGYTVEIVPMLIKVSTINKLTTEALHCRKINLDPKHFTKTFSTTIVVIVAFLTLWIVIDTPTRRQEHIFNSNESINENGNYIIRRHTGCASSSAVWEVLAFVWEIGILMAATVITFQSRNLISALNESHALSFMVYSHFLFLLMRLATNGLVMSGVIHMSIGQKIISMYLSTDTIISILVYFGPKFYNVIFYDEDQSRNKSQVVVATNPTGTRRSRISGVKIPEGGVPNLIGKPQNPRIRASTRSSARRRSSQELAARFFINNPLKMSTSGRRSSHEFVSSLTKSASQKGEKQVCRESIGSANNSHEILETIVSGRRLSASTREGLRITMTSDGGKASSVKSLEPFLRDIGSA